MTTQTDGPAELRAALERTQNELKEAKAENARLLADIKGVRIEKAGFPADQHPHGYRNLVELYEGDLGDLEAIRSFAEERFGYQPVAGSVVEEQPPTEQRFGGDERAEALRTSPGARPAVPPSQDEEQAFVAAINQAESEGRISDAIALRTQLAALRDRKR